MKIQTPDQWYQALHDFIQAQGDGELGPKARVEDGHMLTPRKGWQRRIHGGTLLDFVRFASERAHELYPKLGQNPITERVFVFITDSPGLVAAHELIDQSSRRAIALHRDLWRAWLDDPAQDHDERFALHYECWSVFHRNVEPSWQQEHHVADTQLWVHEEGFALDDGLGRGSQHLWRWDNTQMKLIEQDLTRWVDDERFRATHH